MLVVFVSGPQQELVDDFLSLGLCKTESWWSQQDSFNASFDAALTSTNSLDTSFVLREGEGKQDISFDFRLEVSGPSKLFLTVHHNLLRSSVDLRKEMAVV